MPKNAQTTIRCMHVTCCLSNAQNCSSQASTICELRTSRSTSWIRKGRGTRDQIVNIHWIIEKSREFQKSIYFCFINYAKAFDCVYHNKLWEILKEMGIPDHLTYLLPNLYASEQTGSKLGKKYILSPCLFNLYAEYIMQNARIDEAQTGIKVVGRNINNFRYLIERITKEPLDESKRGE